MKYSHKGNRNILIWDGLDDGITNVTYQFNCPICQHKNNYSIRDLKSFNKLSYELINYIESTKIVSNGKYGYEVKSGIPAYVIPHTCDKCINKLWLVIGMREIQPQRYNIFYKSVIIDKSGSDLIIG